MKEISLSEEYLIDVSGTSDGSQDKYCKDGIWYKADNRRDEGFNEALVSRILECSNLSADRYVTYEQILINGRPGCCSSEFKRPAEEDISIYRLYANTRGGDIARILSGMDMDDAIEYTLSFIKEQTALDLREYLANILALDRLTLNHDRHMNNISVIYDSKTGCFRECPVFDNGRTFFCGVKSYDPEKSVKENIKRIHFRPFSASAVLMTGYLKGSRTLIFDRTKLCSLVDGLEECTAKSVLKYQLNDPGLDYIR